VGDLQVLLGDVLIAEPGVEYGPLLNGPKGCELLEVFARDVLSPGGYGDEYRDHPTLVYLKGLDTTDFFSRPPASVENGRRQTVPVEDCSESDPSASRENPLGGAPDRVVGRPRLASRADQA